MKQQEIIDGNRLIALFDGWELKPIPSIRGQYFYNRWFHPHLASMNEGKEDEMLYHTSWDWLMPVVEKIEGMQNTFVEIGKKHCRIQPIFYNIKTDSMEWQLMHEQRRQSKIEAVYATVISFINWHNQQPK